MSVITYGDYLGFNGPIDSAHSSGAVNTNTSLGPFVNDDNLELCLVMRGLPYRIAED